MQFMLHVTKVLISCQLPGPCFDILKFTEFWFWYPESYLVLVLISWNLHNPCFDILKATWFLGWYPECFSILVLLSWMLLNSGFDVLKATWILVLISGKLPGSGLPGFSRSVNHNARFRSMAKVPRLNLFMDVYMFSRVNSASSDIQPLIRSWTGTKHSLICLASICMEIGELLDYSGSSRDQTSKSKLVGEPDYVSSYLAWASP